MYRANVLLSFAVVAILSATMIPVVTYGNAGKASPALQHGGKAMPMAQSRYGGPSFTGKPALTVTASLVEAGGGPERFSAATALTNMVGAKLVKAEVAKLTKQYGADKVKTWLTVFDFAVKDSLRVATE